eukprot:g8921.t1
MISEITSLFLVNNERFYPFSTAAVVLCTELCDMIGISKKNRGVIKEEEFVNFLNAQTSSPFFNLIETNDNGIAFNEMFSFIFVDFHHRFVNNQTLGYLDLQNTVKETMDGFENFISKYTSIGALRNAYIRKNPMIKSLLQKNGGEAKGWRHMRVKLRATASQNLNTTEGAITAIAGKSLYINAIDSLSKHNLIDEDSKEKPLKDILSGNRNVGLNAVQRAKSKSFGLTYRQRNNNREYVDSDNTYNNKMKNKKKISFMSMARSKSKKHNEYDSVNTEINNLHIKKIKNASNVSKFADV